MAGSSISFLCAEHALGGGMIDRALTLNPNSAHAWMAKGYVSCYQNQPGAAFGAFQRAMRLSPLDPLGYLFNHGLGLAHLATGRYEEAMEWVDRSLREQPRMTSCLRDKVVCCAQLGRIEEARRWLGHLLELQPGLTITVYKAYAASFLPPEITALHVEGFAQGRAARRMTATCRLAAILAADVASYSMYCGGQLA